MLSHYRIEVLEKANTQIAREISILSKQLLPENPDVSVESLTKVIKFPPNHFLVATNNENRIVGMVMLVVLYTVEQCTGYVENLVVDSSVRNQGVASALMEKVMEIAAKMKLNSIHLTSRPSRVAANKFYKKRGFKLHDTNYYKLNLT